jgi:hypothetical protein
MKNHIPVIIVLFALAAGLSACGPSADSASTMDQEPADLFATQTQIQDQAHTGTAIPSIGAGTAAPSPSAIGTATPYSSPTPKPSNTITLTPSWTEDYSDAPCGRVQWIEDITFPDGAEIGPDTVFAKTWRLKNTGRCDWTIETTIDFSRGDRMGAPNEQAIVPENTIVKPGETVDTTVELVSPSTPGPYQGFFKVHFPYASPSGERGFYADISLWVKIRVVNPTPTPSGSPATTVVTGQKTYWPGMEGSVVADCPAGTVITGGGFYLWDADMFIRAKLDVSASSMEGNGWVVSGKNNGAKSGILKVYAICLKHPKAETRQVEAKVPVSSTGKATVACPAGSVATGGGFAGEDLFFESSIPYNNGWQVTAFTIGEEVKDLYAYAVCLTGATADAAPVSGVKTIRQDFSGYAYIECAPGSSITGGGFASGEPSLIVDEASIHGRIWLVHAINFYYGNASFAAHAVCLSVT